MYDWLFKYVHISENIMKVHISKHARSLHQADQLLWNYSVFNNCACHLLVIYATKLTWLAKPWPPCYCCYVSQAFCSSVKVWSHMCEINNRLQFTSILCKQRGNKNIHFRWCSKFAPSNSHGVQLCSNITSASDCNSRITTRNSFKFFETMHP